MPTPALTKSDFSRNSRSLFGNPERRRLKGEREQVEREEFTPHGADLDDQNEFAVCKLNDGDRVFWSAFYSVGFPFEIEADGAVECSEIGVGVVGVGDIAQLGAGVIPAPRVGRKMRHGGVFRVPKFY